MSKHQIFSNISHHNYKQSEYKTSEQRLAKPWSREVQAMEVQGPEVEYEAVGKKIVKFEQVTHYFKGKSNDC